MPTSHWQYLLPLAMDVRPQAFKLEVKLADSQAEAQQAQQAQRSAVAERDAALERVRPAPLVGSGEAALCPSQPMATLRCPAVLWAMSSRAELVSPASCCIVLA